MEGLSIRFLEDLPAQGQLLLDCRHDPWLVLLSYIIATAGSLSTLNITKQLDHVQHHSMRVAWVLVGALCLAGGIWSMHFIGMLAFQAPVAIHYDLTTTLLSLLVALAAALLALYCMAQPRPGLKRQALAACIIGSGIAAMHYSGMAAIRSPAQAYYHGGLLVVSIAIAISASFAALLLAPAPPPLPLPPPPLLLPLLLTVAADSSAATTSSIARRLSRSLSRAKTACATSRGVWPATLF